MMTKAMQPEPAICWRPDSGKQSRQVSRHRRQYAGTYIAKPTVTDGHGDGFGQSWGHEMLIRFTSTGGGFCAQWWKQSRGGSAVHGGRGQRVPLAQAWRRGLQTPRPAPFSQAGLGTLAP